MCLITEQKVPSILEEDLVVYKQLREDMTSVHQSKFRYELNKLYETEIKESKLITNYDFRSWLFWSEDMSDDDKQIWHDSMDRKADKIFLTKHNLKAYGPGFHSFSTLSRINDTGDEDFVIFSCVIPKGAEVYYDKSGLIISNKIKLVEKIKV